MNREGKNGYLTLDSKRRLKAEAQVSTSINPNTALASVIMPCHLTGWRP